MTEKKRYYNIYWLRVLGIFRRLNGSNSLATKLANLVSKPFGPYLFIIPLFLMELLASLSPETAGRRDLGGWSPLTYLVFFVIGYLLATDERYRPTVKKCATSPSP
ncbi:MAG TPA: hypothetical protein VLA49_20120 [Anaerolineales bacterium]|nr:hypothetical protein [Anaerolineales bacterium]